MLVIPSSRVETSALNASCSQINADAEPTDHISVLLLELQPAIFGYLPPTHDPDKVLKHALRNYESALHIPGQISPRRPVPHLDCLATTSTSLPAEIMTWSRLMLSEVDIIRFKSIKEITVHSNLEQYPEITKYRPFKVDAASFGGSEIPLIRYLGGSGSQLRETFVRTSSCRGNKRAAFVTLLGHHGAGD